MSLPVSAFVYTLADNTTKNNGQPEVTTTRFNINTLTAANLVAQTALIGNLVTAVEAVTIGNLVKRETVLAHDKPNSGPSSNVLAQRENKWLFRYHGTTLNQNFQLSIGTADLSKLVSHSEFLDLGTSPGSDLKTAFEAIVVSPNDAAEAVVLDSVQFVGRNN